MIKRPFFNDPNAHADGPPPPPGRAPRPGSLPPTPQQARERYVHPVGILPALQSLLYVLVVALFLMTFTVQPIRIPSPSMEPTLLVGDFLLLDKQSVARDPGFLLPPAGIQRGDIVVFHDPVDDPSVHLVKRVIGLPGDRLHLQSGTVFLNGRPLAETYTMRQRTASDPFRDDFPALNRMDAGVNPAWWIQLRSIVQRGEVTVPDASYFVLGDNRNDSADSRYWGFVPRDAIVGKPLLIYFSWRNPDEQPTQHPPTAGTGPTPTAGTGPNSDTSSGIVQSPPGGPTDFARWDRTFQVVH